MARERAGDKSNCSLSGGEKSELDARPRLTVNGTPVSGGERASRLLRGGELAGRGCGSTRDCIFPA